MHQLIRSLLRRARVDPDAAWLDGYRAGRATEAGGATLPLGEHTTPGVLALQQLARSAYEAGYRAAQTSGLGVRCGTCPVRAEVLARGLVPPEVAQKTQPAP